MENIWLQQKYHLLENQYFLLKVIRNNSGELLAHLVVLLILILRKL